MKEILDRRIPVYSGLDLAMHRRAEFFDEGDLVAFETRISGDETRPKVTPEHYRRVIDGEKLIAEWERLGWEREYVVSGTGFAKYKQDDALVCRFVLRKTP